MSILAAIKRLFVRPADEELRYPRPQSRCLDPYPEDDMHECYCHYQMGNDFWFLPSDRCLKDDK